MQDVVSTPSQARPGMVARVSRFAAQVRNETPSLAECGIALFSALLLILAFPDFNLWPLAWVALIPMMVLTALRPRPWKCFFLGWLCGSVFFYGTCYWLTYSMIHTAGLSPWIAYPVLAPGAVVMGIFPAVFLLLLACVIRRWGTVALFVAPVFWPALEWARLEITGQLWNALGYSQAFHLFIQAATFGGVYAVGFLIVLINAAIARLLLVRDRKALLSLVAAIVFTTMATVGVALWQAYREGKRVIEPGKTVNIIAIQPNVPTDLTMSGEELQLLTSKHFQMTEAALQQVPDDGRPRLVVWPESPMNFAYGSDAGLRETLAGFAQAHQVSLLLNSQETAPNNGIYNSAMLVNDQGKLVTQYDKIRLLPFGEYVPLPRWVPGSGLIRAIVGDFTPGTNYRLVRVGEMQAGVFICIESAYPSIARRFTQDGADVLINISNDGYLGPTAVMRQHLANAVFRAVENGRPLLSVTNTGITAYITKDGEVKDATEGFKPEIRVWQTSGEVNDTTFYSQFGDVFVISLAVVSLLIMVFAFTGQGKTAG